MDPNDQNLQEPMQDQQNQNPQEPTQGSMPTDGIGQNGSNGMPMSPEQQSPTGDAAGATQPTPVDTGYGSGPAGGVDEQNGQMPTGDQNMPGQNGGMGGMQPGDVASPQQNDQGDQAGGAPQFGGQDGSQGQGQMDGQNAQEFQGEPGEQRPPQGM